MAMSLTAETMADAFRSSQKTKRGPSPPAQFLKDFEASEEWADTREWRDFP